jgi:hypothetical protein
MMNNLNNSKDLLHEFYGEVDGKKRWAQVFKVPQGFHVSFFINQIFQQDLVIENHSEQYAEDAAENFTLGILNLD